jgi:hypothetical protein
MHGTPLARATVGAALLLLTVACADSPTQVGMNGPAAFVSLTLRHENGVLDSAGASGSAMILDYLMPYDVRYREVSDFRMTRRGDGAAFDWEERIPGRKSAVSNTFSSEPNWVLRWTGTGGRLGLRDVQPGDTFDLAIETGSRTIVSSVVVPGVPVLTFGEANGVDMVHWRRVRGAVFYEVFAPSESNEIIYTSDSSLVINNTQGHSSASVVTATVYDASTARRRLSALNFPQSQDGVRFEFAAVVSDRIAIAP